MEREATSPGAEAGTSDELPPFYLIVTFWGRRFIDFVCKFTLPSLLASGNIPTLENRESCRFLICTTRADREALQNEPTFRHLAEQIQVAFIDNEEARPGEHKYVRMARGHALLTQRCYDHRAIGVFISPDSIYPEGSLAEAQRLARLGKELLLCAAIRFDMDGIEQELAAGGYFGRDVLAIPKRDAVAMGLRHLHAESRASDWAAANFGRLHAWHGRRFFLTCCYWHVPDEDGVIIITHNWTPFVMNFAKLRRHSVAALDGRAIDGDYIFENFSDEGIGSRIHVVDDSDSLFLLGLTPRDEMVPPNDAPWWLSLRPVAGWSRGYILNRTVFDPGVDRLRRQIYGIPVRWHARDLTPRWADAEAQVKRLLERYVARDVDRDDERSGWVERRWRRLLRRRLLNQ
jgi:hypothetical protein